MKQLMGEYWREFGWMFLLAGIVIGVEARTIVDVGIMLVFVVLLVVWVIQWRRRKRAMAKVNKTPSIKT